MNGAVRTYGYDNLNRLTSAVNGSTWSEGYSYDRYGNRAFTAARSGLPALTSEAVVSLGAYGTGRNRINGFSYDGRGNATNTLTRTATYDGENRQISVTPSGNAQQTYAYDAQGQRVRKTVDGVATTFVYDGTGQLAAEYGGAVSATGVQYLTADHLGSTRLVTNEAGQQVSASDYLPFGAELGATYPQPAGGLSVKFTGKERDAETGLDYFGARYMSAAQGRFTSVDPHNEGVQINEPQSWNGFAYAANNPLRYIDPDGRDYHFCMYGKCEDISDYEYEKWQKSRGQTVIYRPGGDILDRDTEAKIGHATHFDGDAARRAENAVGLLNFFVINQTADMVGGALGAGLSRIIPPQIARNAFKGALGERVIEATLRLKGYKIIGRHVTAKTTKGIRYVDYVVERAGEYTAIEVKSGGAVRNASQLAKEGAMESQGALLGNNAGALEGQVMKLKTVEMRPF